MPQQVDEAKQELARAQVEATEAKLELAKLQALERANPETAAKQHRGEFYGRAASSQKDHDAAFQKAWRAEAEAREKQQRWEELARKVPATS